MRKFITIMLFGTFTMLLAQSTAPKLYINEFMASNDTAYADENGEYDDWIEIYNDEDIPVHLGGMYITDDLSNPSAWQIPDLGGDTTVVPAKGFIILWADKQPEQGWNHVNIKLSGGGEQIGLSMAVDTGIVWIDSLTYGDQTTDFSEARMPDAGSYWMNFNIGTPGKSNLTGYPLKLYINEFMASNDTSYADENGEYDDWIEIYNAEEFPVSLGGMYITDDLTDAGAWQIPVMGGDTTVVPAGGFVILWADKQPEQGWNHVNIKLSGSGEQIGLSVKTDTVYNWVDSLTYTAQTTDISEGRMPDGADYWLNFLPSSPGETNENGTPTAIDEEKFLPEKLVLEQNYPNPFNPVTTIRFTMPAAGNLSIDIFNALGQKVATLYNGKHNGGQGSVTWNAAGHASGLYFVRMIANGQTNVRKMILSK